MRSPQELFQKILKMMSDSGLSLKKYRDPAVCSVTMPTGVIKSYPDEELPEQLSRFIRYSDSIDSDTTLNTVENSFERKQLLFIIGALIDEYVRAYSNYYNVDDDGSIMLLTEQGLPGLKIYLEQSVEYGIAHNPKVQKIVNKLLQSWVPSTDADPIIET